MVDNRSFPMKDKKENVGIFLWRLAEPKRIHRETCQELEEPVLSPEGSLPLQCVRESSQGWGLGEASLAIGPRFSPREDSEPRPQRVWRERQGPKLSASQC